MSLNYIFVSVDNTYIMKNKLIEIKLKVARYDELSECDRHLVDDARNATAGSYSPYSRFRVGAAILLENGVTVTGANQENAAFPSGICAERSACYYAGAAYPGVPFRKIAIAARGTDGEEVADPISPCGACRQALLEYEKLAGSDVEVLLAGRSDIYIIPSVRSLMPLSFSEF